MIFQWTKLAKILIKTTALFFYPIIGFLQVGSCEEKSASDLYSCFGTTNYKLKSDSNSTYINPEYDITRPFRALLLMKLGLGHHDNLTKEQSTLPKAKTSTVSGIVEIEFGVIYNRFYLVIPGSVNFPIPITSYRGGYRHESGYTSWGLKFGALLLPYKWKLNLNACVGLLALNEVAHISDPDEVKPDLLNINYKERAPIFGIALHYKFDRGQAVLVLDYLREEHSIGSNRYRVEFRTLLPENPLVKQKYGFIGGGFEYRVWNDKRRDWFYIISFGLGIVN